MGATPEIVIVTVAREEEGEGEGRGTITETEVEEVEEVVEVEEEEEGRGEIGTRTETKRPTITHTKIATAMDTGDIRCSIGASILLSNNAVHYFIFCSAVMLCLQR